MPDIPSVEALAPLVLIPGEHVFATASLTPLLPKDAAGEPTETVEECTLLTVTGSGLVIDDAGDVVVADTSLSFWVDATSAAHNQRFKIVATFKARPVGAGDGSQDRTRKAILPVVIREKGIP